MKRIGYDYNYTYEALSEMRETIRDTQVDGQDRRRRGAMSAQEGGPSVFFL
jgi:hypothetical protein